MVYNTNNPLGSNDFRDLSDNATNFDLYSCGPQPAYPNRFGALKLSIEGQQQAFATSEAGRQAAFTAFLEASGYYPLGDYGAGITFTTRTQYTVRDGILYRVAPSTTLPYTTTGNWAIESSKFVAFDTESLLKQDLLSSAGAGMVGFSVGLSYPENTVGKELVELSGSAFRVGDSSSEARTFNSAIIAAMPTGSLQQLPAGVVWVAADTELKGVLRGVSRDSTIIKGDGNLFKISTAPTVEIGFRDLSIQNDVTRGILLKNYATTDSQGQTFHRVYFGKSTIHYESAAPNTVHVRVFECRFLDASLHSRLFVGLWGYTEYSSYTWYCKIGIAVTAQSVACSIFGGVYEYNTSYAIALSPINHFTTGWGFYVVHFEGNGSGGSGIPDVLLRTTTAQRIRCILFSGCTFYLPHATQPYRVLTEAGGGGNIDNVKFENCVVTGEVPLCPNVSYITQDDCYLQTGTVPTNVKVPVRFNSVLGNCLGVSHTLSGLAGNLAVLATITPPAGTGFVRVSVRGEKYGTLAHDGFLEAAVNIPSASVRTVVTFDNSTGSAQGFTVAWNGTAVVVSNKTGLSQNQSCRVTCEFFT